jgi:choline transporter-like protein 2/4/5
MIVVAGFGFYKGKPTQLFYFYDSDGNACGHDDGYDEFPYLYFTKVISGLTEANTDVMLSAVCVKKCPFNEDTTATSIVLDCKPTTGMTNCEIDQKDYYESKPLLGKICFPKTNDEITYDATRQYLAHIYDPDTGETFKKVINNADTITDTGPDGKTRVFIAQEAINGEKDPEKSSAKLINFAYFTQLFTLWINDLNVTKWAIVGSIGWSFFLAMFYFLFLRCCAGFITFFLIMLVEAGLVVLAVYFKLLSQKEEEIAAESDTTDLAFFWVFTALAAAWLLFILIMCNRIRLAVALTQVTSKYINKTWCIVFVPFLFFVILIIWLAYWIIMLVFLYTSGKFEKGKAKVFASFEMDEKLEYGFWFHIVMLFYITAIIEAYSQFVYASSACIWYFNFEKGTENHPIAKSFHRGVRYHFGSLVFGATIIAIIRFLMFFVEVIKKKLEKSAGKTQGKCFKCIFCCIQCCLGCCNKIMEFINKHAYIQIALKGDSFCTAAFEGFGLIIRNLGRFSMLALIGGIFSIIGTIFITVGSCIIGYFLITRVHYFSDELNSCVLPVVAFGIVGFVMGKVTMSIFSVSGDALIHSFLLDEELNKGQPKAFPELQKFMNDER